jgi:hypothetical protein
MPGRGGLGGSLRSPNAGAGANTLNHPNSPLKKNRVAVNGRTEEEIA